MAGGRVGEEGGREGRQRQLLGEGGAGRHTPLHPSSRDRLRERGVTGQRGPVGRGESREMARRDGASTPQQARTGRPRSPAAAGLLIIKLNYLRAIRQLGNSRDQCEKGFGSPVTSSPFPFPAGPRLKIQTHP